LGRRYLSKNNAAAFTLIELLVAIAIIGVLAGGAFFALNPAGQFAKSRDIQRKNDLERIKVALDTYYNDNNNYPIDRGTIGTASWGGEWKPYMAEIPQDPLSTQSYYYDSDGSSYRLYANLERCSDSRSVAGVDCQRTGKNYSVSSSNLAALTPMPIPTVTPIPGSCASFSNSCAVCLGAGYNKCGWDGSNCKNYAPFCSSGQTKWYINDNCSRNRCGVR